MAQLAMHIVLKYSDTYYNVDTIEEHKKIINKYSKVIWGVIRQDANSNAMGLQRVQLLNIQIEKNIPTYAFISSGGRIKYKCNIEKVYRRDELKEHSDFIPEYYRHELDKCANGILLSSMETESNEIISKMRMYDTDDRVISLGNQTNPIYVSLDIGEAPAVIIEKPESEKSDRKYWIEKTIVEGRQDRLIGDRALGKALWSPRKSKVGTDIYQNMRRVKEGDIVLHLIDNQKISGISRVRKEAFKTNGLAGTEWDVPSYLIELENYIELNPPIYRNEIVNNHNEKLLHKISEKYEVFYTVNLDLRQGAYLTPCPLELLQLLNFTYKRIANKNLPFLDGLDFIHINKETQKLNSITQKYLSRFLTIKTKPFIILAGLSGTGKSRLVRTLAYLFNNFDSDRTNKKHPPTNFHILKVKPNWHDSSELLGYESRISGKDRFIVTDFIRFIVKAAQYPDTPFFLCLDEMNLAPVEQYFAEYLSAIETRKLNENEIIKTDPLISNSIFKKYADKSDGVDSGYDLWKELELEDKNIQKSLREEGLVLPPNLIVMGTVNMDETTHSFSRKVLDRAMTIEMNEINLSEVLTDFSDDWNYPAECLPGKIIISEKTQGNEVADELGNDGTAIIKYLISVNEKLESTPFKVAYRVRDEFLLYTYNYSLIKDKPDDWLIQVLDEMTLMKILPRIEGDEEKTALLDELITLFEANKLKKSIKKASEMINRRNSYHYTSFWS